MYHTYVGVLVKIKMTSEDVTPATNISLNGGHFPYFHQYGKTIGTARSAPTVIALALQ